jgi:hypothetical protein
VAIIDWADNFGGDECIDGVEGSDLGGTASVGSDDDDETAIGAGAE